MFHQRRIAEEYLSHNLDDHCLEDTRLTWCLFYPSGGAPFPGRYVSWYLRRLIVEIDYAEVTCQPTNIMRCFILQIGDVFD